MASPEEAIIALCNARTTLVSRFAARVYDTILPADGTTVQTYPALTFQIMDRRDTRTFAGNGKEYSVAVQFDTWATTAADRRNAAADLRSALATWSGAWGGVHVFRAFKDTDFDTTEAWDDGGQFPAFRNVQRWTVWIREP